MKRFHAYAHVELILAVGLAAASVAVLLPQLSGKQPSQESVASKEAHEPPMLIDDFRIGDSIESVEQRLSGLGQVRETREKLLTRVSVWSQTPDAHFRSVFKAGRLVSAWQTMPLPGTGRPENVVLRVLNGDSEEESQDLAAYSPN